MSGADCSRQGAAQLPRQLYQRPDLHLIQGRPATNDERYEEAKADWDRDHPDASPREREAAMRRLATELEV